MREKHYPLVWYILSKVISFLDVLMGTISMDCQQAPLSAFGNFDPREFVYFISRVQTNISNY